MKAKKGKSGCLKSNGRLKKGFRWAKGRKGHCVLAKKAKAKTTPKRRSKSNANLKRRVKKAVKDYIKKLAKKATKKAELKEAADKLNKLHQEIRVAQIEKEEAEWRGSMAVDGL